MKTADSPLMPILPGQRRPLVEEETPDDAAQTERTSMDQRVRPYLPVDIVNEIRRCFPDEDVAEVSVRLLRYALMSGGSFHPTFQDINAAQHALRDSLDGLALCTLELNRELNNLGGALELQTMMQSLVPPKPSLTKLITPASEGTKP